MTTCNICGYEGEFLSYRDKPSRKCPECGSLERHRNFFKYIKKNDLLTNKRILHIAPETQLSELVRKKSEKYYCLDQTPNKIYISKDDLTDLNVFKDNTFDIVICFHVLEHIVNDTKALLEIKRVLRPNGLAFICVPLKEKSTYIWTEEDINEQKKDGKWGITGKFEGHYRTYGGVEFPFLLKKCFREINFSNNKKMTGADFFICKK